MTVANSEPSGRCRFIAAAVALTLTGWIFYHLAHPNTASAYAAPVYTIIASALATACTASALGIIRACGPLLLVTCWLGGVAVLHATSGEFLLALMLGSYAMLVGYLRVHTRTHIPADAYAAQVRAAA